MKNSPEINNAMYFEPFFQNGIYLCLVKTVNTAYKNFNSSYWHLNQVAYIMFWFVLKHSMSSQEPYFKCKIFFLY